MLSMKQDHSRAGQPGSEPTDASEGLPWTVLDLAGPRVLELALPMGASVDT